MDVSLPPLEGQAAGLLVPPPSSNDPITLQEAPEHVHGQERPYHSNVTESRPQVTEPVIESKHSEKTSFDCNICLDTVSWPIVTICGHLYCWPCIYTWLIHHSNCPVCKSMLQKQNIIPIYGRSDKYTNNLPQGTKNTIPSRPSASHVPLLGSTRAMGSSRLLDRFHSFGTSAHVFFPSFLPIYFRLELMNVPFHNYPYGPQTARTRYHHFIVSNILICIERLLESSSFMSYSSNTYPSYVKGNDAPQYPLMPNPGVPPHDLPSRIYHPQNTQHPQYAPTYSDYVMNYVPMAYPPPPPNAPATDIYTGPHAQMMDMSHAPSDLMRLSPGVPYIPRDQMMFQTPHNQIMMLVPPTYPLRSMQSTKDAQMPPYHPQDASSISNSSIQLLRRSSKRPLRFIDPVTNTVVKVNDDENVTKQQPSSSATSNQLSSPSLNEEPEPWDPSSNLQPPIGCLAKFKANLGKLFEKAKDLQDVSTRTDIQVAEPTSVAPQQDDKIASELEEIWISPPDEVVESPISDQGHPSSEPTTVVPSVESDKDLISVVDEKPKVEVEEATVKMEDSLSSTAPATDDDVITVVLELPKEALAVNVEPPIQLQLEQKHENSTPKTEEVEFQFPSGQMNIPERVDAPTEEGEMPTADEHVPENVAPEIFYPPGCWSPSNPTGKKVYPRNFLMQFENLVVPLPIPGIPVEIALTSQGIDSAGDGRSSSLRSLLPNNRAPVISRVDKIRRASKAWPPGASGGSSMGGGPHSSLSSSYLSSGISGIGSGSLLSSGGGSQSSLGRSGFGSGSFGKSSNGPSSERWATRARHVRPYQIREDADELEHLTRTIRGLLNRLAPETFNPLLDRLVALPINTIEAQLQLIDIITEKALTEFKFAALYSQLCFELDKRLQPVKTHLDPEQTFFRSILNKCQYEFETRFKTEAIESFKNLDPEQQLKEKGKTLGLARFVGELYNVGLLKRRALQNCFHTLLDRASELDIEQLCLLITITGSKLMQSNDVELLHQTIERLKEATMRNDRNRTSSRTICLVQDVLDLDAKQWQSSHGHNNIQSTGQYLSNKQSAQRASSGHSSGKRREASRPSSGISYAQISRNAALKSSSHQDLMSHERESRVSMPAGQSHSAMRSNAQHNGTSKSHNAPPISRTTSLPAQSFQHASTAPKASHAQRSEPASKSSVPSMQKVQEPTPSAPEQPVQSTRPFLDESNIDQVTEEFLTAGDTADFLLNVESMPNSVAVIVIGLLSGAIEKNRSHIFPWVSDALLKLMHNPKIDRIAVVQGIRMLILENLRDILVDAPKADHNIGLILAPVVLNEGLSLAELSSIFRPLAANQCKTFNNLLDSLFANLAKKNNLSQARKLLGPQATKIQEILHPSSSLQDFIQRNQLQELFGTT